MQILDRLKAAATREEMLAIIDEYEATGMHQISPGDEFISNRTLFAMLNYDTPEQMGRALQEAGFESVIRKVKGKTTRGYLCRLID